MNEKLLKLRSRCLRAMADNNGSVLEGALRQMTLPEMKALRKDAIGLSLVVNLYMGYLPQIGPRDE